MRFVYRMGAGENTRFAPGFLDAKIGERIPLTYNGKRVSTATLTAVEVVDDGREALLTVELPGHSAVADMIRAPLPGFSFAFQPDDPEFSIKVPPAEPFPIQLSDRPPPGE